MNGPVTQPHHLVTQPHHLLMSMRPTVVGPKDAVRIVDLFAGCGGLTLGLMQGAQSAARGVDIRMAVDFDESALRVYSANFAESSNVVAVPVESIFDGNPGSRVTETEDKWRSAIGEVDVLVGGPPCQGNSTLNNHTRGSDPKNALYLLMGRAAQVLSPGMVIIENVPAVVHAVHAGKNVVETVRETLLGLGYQVADQVIALGPLGIAQRRKRHLLIATKKSCVAPQQVFERMLESAQSRDLRWAIGDLEESEGLGWDRAPIANAVNLARMKYLLDRGIYDLPNDQRPTCQQGDHSYKSMYGRLRWDEPAQTVTSGYGSIGQGRYMHPSKLRALTAHEAARIQGFPDYFDFSSISSRTQLSVMIGNAVPPALGNAILASYIALTRSEESGAESRREFVEASG
jgi:DNA (cytosine-5)-methyltransferase 1